MKSNQIIKLILVVLMATSSHSVFSVDIKAQPSWGNKIINKIRFYHMNYSKPRKHNKNYSAKIKLYIDEKGNLYNSEILEIKGDVFYAKSIAQTIINSLPLPAPSKNYTKSDRIVTFSFN